MQKPGWRSRSAPCYRPWILNESGCSPVSLELRGLCRSVGSIHMSQRPGIGDVFTGRHWCMLRMRSRALHIHDEVQIRAEMNGAAPSGQYVYFQYNMPYQVFHSHKSACEERLAEWKRADISVGGGLFLVFCNQG